VRIVSRSTWARPVPNPSVFFALSSTASMLPCECASHPAASMHRSGPQPHTATVSSASMPAFSAAM
jgi:hypothetical protein